MTIRRIRVVIDARKTEASVIPAINELAKRYPGATPVVIDMTAEDGPFRMQLGQRAEPCEEFYAGVRALGWSAIPEAKPERSSHA